MLRFAYVFVAVLALFTAVGCGGASDDSLSVRVDFMDDVDEDRQYMELNVVPSCGEFRMGVDPVDRVMERVGMTQGDAESAPSFRGKYDGRNAVYARAFSASCEVIAAGCTEFVAGEIPGELEVKLSAATCDGEDNCGTTVCVDDNTPPPDDGGVDDPPCEGSACLRDCDSLAGSSGILFCDDFEGPLSGWSSPTQGPAPVIVAAPSATETGFLRFAPPPGGHTILNDVSRAIGAGAARDIYVRAYVRIPAGDSASGGSFLSLRSDLAAAPSRLLEFAVGVGENAQGLGTSPRLWHWDSASPDGFTNVSAWKGGTASLPRDTWSCVSVHIERGTVAAGTALAELAVSGAGAGTYADRDTSAAMATIHIGPMYSVNCADDSGACVSQFSVEFDQVAVSTAELPCE